MKLDNFYGVSQKTQAPNALKACKNPKIKYDINVRIF